jgi:iron complex transport system ATP-binding protein
VLLDQKDIFRLPTTEVAKKMAVLPQSPAAPAGLTVEELVGYGRYPHQTGFGALGKEDAEKISWALSLTGLVSFRERDVDTLSGGQRQRVWIAMALAQDTEAILLDEPTTYLDLVHQLDVLQLLHRLNRDTGRTIALVIHDLNMAARISDYMIAIKEGAIVAQGKPESIMTRQVLHDVFSIDAMLATDPRTGRPVCITYDIPL